MEIEVEKGGERSVPRHKGPDAQVRKGLAVFGWCRNRDWTVSPEGTWIAPVFARMRAGSCRERHFKGTPRYINAKLSS